jgi:hypothetical protein
MAMTGRHLTMLMLVAGPLACGGTGKTGDSLIGAVDLTQAPSTLTMSCGAGVAAALEMPCLIGLDLSGQDPNAAGVHATECRLASPDQPLVWSFLLPLGDVRADPSTSLQAPVDLPPQLTGVTMSTVTGDLTFSRVDPAARAFIGAFHGNIAWSDQAGTQTSCQVDGPFWGAPGDFL